MIKILFICHGNICRSPMAEFVLKKMAEEAGCAGDLMVASAATSGEELGNPVYPPVRKLLERNGIRCDGKTARRLTKQDYDKYDLLIGMDRMNMANMKRICGPDPLGKMHLLMDYSAERTSEDVADPWYTGDFEAAWRDVKNGCTGLLAKLRREMK